MTNNKDLISFEEKVNDIYANIYSIKVSSESIRSKFCKLWEQQNIFFDILLESNSTFFTDYAKLLTVISKYNISKDIKSKFIKFKTIRKYILKNNTFSPTELQVNFYKDNLCYLINYITNFEIPIELLEEESIYQEVKTDFLLEEDNNLENGLIDFFKVLFIKRTEYEDFSILTCIDEEANKVNIILSKSVNNMLIMAWKYSNILFFNLKKIELDILLRKSHIIYESLYKEIEQSEDKLSYCYLVTSKTIAVLEPDFLIDVTEICLCFNKGIESPIIPIIKKFISLSTNDLFLKGNIVNELFDILLENKDCDFNHALSISINKHSLSFLVVQNAFISNSIIKEENSIVKFIRSWRSYFFSIFKMLYDIIIKNYSSTENYIEPTFMSYKYGLQGRLDLMTIDKEKNINVVELKSGKPPTSTIQVNIGLNELENQTLFLPLWINHYIQIVCYNILLRATYKNRKGNSSILYANTAIDNKLRCIIDDNEFVHRDIINNRNWIVAYYRELSLKNTSIFNECFNAEQMNSMSKFLKNDIESFYIKLNRLSDIEKRYFTEQVAFITKEIFSNKVGYYSDRQNRTDSISSFWLTAFEEKQQNLSIISDLTFSPEESDFEQLHLKFKKSSNDKFSIFRVGDICRIYPQKIFINETDDINLVSEKQLLRGVIVAITETTIEVSLRNKFIQKASLSKNLWCIEKDYMESANSALYNSLNNFIFNIFDNKDYILGLKEANICYNDEINDYINNIQDLDEEKKIIIKKAISSKNYFLIQGPPGTGKTSFILRYLVKVLIEKTDENILLLANTNRAVDEICSALLKISNDFPFIKLGHDRVSNYKENLICFIPYDQLNDKIRNTRVFVSTVATANKTDEIFELKKFDTIIIDEATQILEVQIVGLLSKVNRFIMIGDEKQLPPISTVSDKELMIEDATLNSIEFNNLKDSLFERLLRLSKKNSWNVYGLLTEQSRMSMNVMRLCNTLFYKNRLKKRTDVVKNNLKNVFINTEIEKYVSKVNMQEVDIVINLINSIEFNEVLEKKTIGVISPWRLQCNEIYKRLTAEQKNKITVDTVERFQGSERDIIIYSTTTNNSFLLDLLSVTKIIDGIEVDRKLNVVISRAREQFILLGNRELLSKKQVYRKLIELIETE